MADPKADAATRAAILAGDPEGLKSLWERHFRPLYAFCWHRTGRDREAAEEATREALLLGLERIGEFDPDRGDLDTWLAFLSRNVIRDANRRVRRFVAMEADVAAAGAGDASESGLAERHETAARVGVALERLPGRYREVLDRKYLRGESVRSIAAAAASTEKAVESLLVRAREAFKRAFLSVTNVLEPAPRAEAQLEVRR